MSITSRRARWVDIEEGLAIQPCKRGDALVGIEAAMEAWKYLFASPFFISGVLEFSPPVRGHRLIGIGAAIFISSEFAATVLSDLRPDINSRLIRDLLADQPVLPGLHDIARANAGDGVEVLVLCGHWMEDILTPEERNEMQTVMAFSFAEQLSGYRIPRIFHETACEPSREFAARSIVYQPLAAFPELGRVIHLMDSDSVRQVPASIGNVIFAFREPMLRLRDSDQQLLSAALKGATDAELAAELGVTCPAVKARWRSTFERIGKVMPELGSDEAEHDGHRGTQKRHRILAYVRNHPEELRPYDWKLRTGVSPKADKR